MAQNPSSKRGRVASSASSDDPYCEFIDDRERRNALVSRDLRIVVCRLFTVAGLVMIAVFAPTSVVLHSV